MNDRNRQQQALATINDDLHRMKPEFALVLDPKIPPDKFVRVAMTAIQRNPDLLGCSRRSLFLAVQACAQDSLLPDGKEAVLTPFQNTVAYIPMIAGLRRKLREAIDVADLSVELVRDGDAFSYVLGDEPHIHHIPDLNGTHERPITHVYSIVRFKDGSISRNVMTWGEVMMIRDRYARSRKGPWFDKAAIGEMGKKTCLKRHMKLLPTSAELDRVFDRDNELYDVSSHSVKEDHKPIATQRNVMAALDAFSSAGDDDGINEDHIRMVSGEDGITVADDYINYVNVLISEADSTEGIEFVRKFWANSTPQREALGLSQDDIKTLATHIRHLTVPDKGDDDASADIHDG